jgi:hypothetical protein
MPNWTAMAIEHLITSSSLLSASQNRIRTPVDAATVCLKDY